MLSCTGTRTEEKKRLNHMLIFVDGPCLLQVNYKFSKRVGGGIRNLRTHKNEWE